MALSDALSDPPANRRVAEAVLSAPFRIRTYAAAAYLALSFPLGIAYFVCTAVGLSLGVSLSVLLVGVPILAATLGGVVLVSIGERVLARRLLGADIADPSWKVTEASGIADRALAAATDLAVWGALLFVLSKLIIGVAGFTLLTVVLSVGASLLAAPLYYDAPGASVGLILPEPIRRELSLVVPWEQFEVGVSFIVRLTSWEVSTLPGALLMSLFGVLAALVGLNVVSAAGWLCARWAEFALGAGTSPVSDD
ncbi:sensor domain-containing protein [Halorubrum ezzemoulense]|uniref:sensor domain-containing protein n=1 Tax=Halorubrum ezzemoulense TaxID=337243 RepID=UPI00232C63BA|nr:sensor domain-containing protein [Halorubrum ezzemoulense]MDB2260164.1 sensor domain-containing protein [Halorubrum ezzemoulense]MDB2266602.1 sensor domain-containing protein [Halorubrum ezzemoulense]